jgi:hypothetical protein
MSDDWISDVHHGNPAGADPEHRGCADAEDNAATGDADLEALGQADIAEKLVTGDCNGKVIPLSLALFLRDCDHLYIQ